MILFAAAWAACESSSEDVPHEVRERSTGPLMATNRSMLSVCVDGVRGVVADESDTNVIDSALEDALATQVDVPSEFDERVVELGCPGRPAGLDDESESLAGVVRGGFRVAEPSPHRLFVFIVPDAALSDLPYVVGNAEYVLEGDVGQPVSTALYITPESSDEALRDGLLVALSLESPEPAPLSTEEQRDEGTLLIGNPIRASNRDSLSICIDGARGYSVTDADGQRIGDALDTAVVGFDEEVPVEYADRSVVIGCPPPPQTLLEDPIDYIELQDDAPAVDVPSRHRAFMYLLPEEVYSRSLDPLPYFIGNAEVVCGGDVCSTVTTAVYVPASIGVEDLNELLLGAIGLRIPQRHLED